MVRNLLPTLAALFCVAGYAAAQPQGAEPPTRIVTVRPGPDWERKPTSEEMKAVEPVLPGNVQATLRCRVRADGSLYFCNPEHAARSSPEVTAALKLIPLYRLSRRDAANIVKQDAFISFEVTWRIVCGIGCVMTLPAPPTKVTPK